VLSSIVSILSIVSQVAGGLGHLTLQLAGTRLSMGDRLHGFFSRVIIRVDNASNYYIVLTSLSRPAIIW
jgi:hypothetical protein